MLSETVFDKGIAALESILKPDTKVYSVLDDEQRQSLSSLRDLLLAGDHNKKKYVPVELLDNSDQESATSTYILESFAGIKPRPASWKRVKGITKAVGFINSAKKMVSQRYLNTSVAKQIPSEWDTLPIENRNRLKQVLSWESLCKWDFDALELKELTNGKSLLFLGWAIFWSPTSQMAMMEESSDDTNNNNTIDFYNGYNFDSLGLTWEKLNVFLRTVQSGYNDDNKYHNSCHAADVLQGTHALLQMGGKEYASSPLEIYSLLLAAAVHDIGHPGKNNVFQINSESDVALEYNDKSVLENMHAATVSKLIFGKKKKAQLNILEYLQPEKVKIVRNLMIDSILGTDMAFHFKKVSEMKGYLTQLGPNSNPESFLKYERGQLAYEVLYYILHLADISNPSRPTTVCTKWTDLVCEEFFLQGDEEAKDGLPISPLCDRHTTDIPDSQVGFNKFVVRPAYEILGELIPSVKKEILPLLDTNLTYWEEQKSDASNKPVVTKEKKGKIADVEK